MGSLVPRLSRKIRLIHGHKQRIHGHLIFSFSHQYLLLRETYTAAWLADVFQHINLPQHSGASRWMLLVCIRAAQLTNVNLCTPFQVRQRAYLLWPEHISYLSYKTNMPVYSRVIAVPNWHRTQWCVGGTLEYYFLMVCGVLVVLWKTTLFQHASCNDGLSLQSQFLLYIDSLLPTSYWVFQPCTYASNHWSLPDLMLSPTSSLLFTSLTFHAHTILQSNILISFPDHGRL